MILVTGGAGFIGANFILDWFAAGAEPVVNLIRSTQCGLGHLDATDRPRPKVPSRVFEGQRKR